MASYIYDDNQFVLRAQSTKTEYSEFINGGFIDVSQSYLLVTPLILLFLRLC